MKAKKLISTLLAGAMALSMAVPAFASSANTTKITGTYQAVTIDVTVPTTGTAVINPYGLPIKLTAKSTDANGDSVTTEGTISKQGITTNTPLAIVNKASVDLDVNAVIKGTPKTGSSLTFAADKDGIQNNGSTNAVLAVFQIKEAPTLLHDADDASKSTVDTKGTIDATALMKLFAVVNKDDGTPDTATGWTALTDAEMVTGPTNKTVVVGTTEVDTSASGADGDNGVFYDSTDKVSRLLTLKAAKTLKDAETEKNYAAVQKNGVAIFRLTGLAETKTKNEWKTTDGMEVTIAFTFTPSVSS